jgi:1-acyl-sn-glycerol-3-phosphate acyltransferase
MMIKALSYYWRLFATGLCFTVFGLGAAMCGMLVFPLLRLLPGEAEAHRRRVRATSRAFMRSFVWLMNATGVLSYEFIGAERLGRPGQIILANHPSLIDVVFLIGFTPQATCIVKGALFHNPLTRWPVAAAGYVSNTSTMSMVERASQALRNGQNVIVFPEGTRTIPGQPLQFHRGAASIAVRAASVVTPVFIRCDPTTLAKNMPWYRIPDRRVLISFRVGADIDPAAFRHQPAPLASRAFNAHLLKVFAEELGMDARAAGEARDGSEFADDPAGEPGPAPRGPLV